MKFLTGKDYPDMCKECRALIDDIAQLFASGLMPDTDDPEAPIMYVYDNKLYCGGYTCVNKRKQQREEMRAEDHHELRRKEMYGHA